MSERKRVDAGGEAVLRLCPTTAQRHCVYLMICRLQTDLLLSKYTYLAHSNERCQVVLTVPQLYYLTRALLANPHVRALPG